MLEVFAGQLVLDRVRLPDIAHHAAAIAAAVRHQDELREGVDAVRGARFKTDLDLCGLTAFK